MSIFDTVPGGKLSRSSFHFRPELKTSFNFGGIYPIYCNQVLPGDRMSMGVENFIRTMPLLSPVMHRNDIKIDAFFVPYRLIWSKSEDCISLEDETLEVPTYLMSVGGTSQISDDETTRKALFGEGSLADYLGFSTTHADSSFANFKFNRLPFSAYNLVYNEYYRNQELEDELPVDKDENSFKYISTTDGFNSRFQVRYRSWRRDYFTSALPTPSAGPDVYIPTPDYSVANDGKLVLTSKVPAGGKIGEGDIYQTVTSSGVKRATYEQDATVTDVNLVYQKGLKLNSANAPTMQDLRYAEVLDEFYMAKARGGSRFKEWLLNIWHTNSPDARLDRPEYLGGYRGPIQISEVPQTSQGTATSSQGTLTGKGLSVGGNVLFYKHTFKEPGILLVNMSVVPKSAYTQGDPRWLMYRNGFDFPNPYFAHLGEQPIWNGELYSTQQSTRYDTWGYSPRYAECKQEPDRCSGQMRSTLAFWHEARIFQSLPNLNEAFVKMYPQEVARIFPDLETSDKLVGEFFFDIRVQRSLPYYGVPKLGHGNY